MDKLIDSMSFSEDWKVTLLESTSGLEKAAAAQEVMDFSKTIEKDPSKYYLHINAMGAGEYFGSNRNGDYFPEDNLLQWYKTFETSPAHVFRHHVNKDPSIAIGKVIFSYYNPRMHRVELIAEVDREKGAPELQAIERGEFPMTSMACHTPYDVCSVCGNKAHTRAQYCEHLATQLNKTLPDGRRVMSLNVGPLKFFDISMVIRPADVTSSVLQKVASNDDMPTVGSAEAAELEGVGYGREKTASIKKEAIDKMADFIKEIPGEIDAHGDSLQSILSRTVDPEDDILRVIKAYPLDSVITSLAHLGISPSVHFLVKILAGKYVGSRESEIANAAMATFKAMGVEAIPDSAADLIPEISDLEPDPYLIKALVKYVDGSSLQRDYVEKRAFHTGYANWQTGRDAHIQQSPVMTEDDNPLLKLVGAAIIAKIAISTIVGHQSKTGLDTGVEKSAALTIKLMDLSTHSELKEMKECLN